MIMSSAPASYPSPTQQHASPAYGPFYGNHQQQHHHHNGAQSTTIPGQEMADDTRLRNELSRSLAPTVNQSSPPLLSREQHGQHGQHEHPGQEMAPQHYNGHPNENGLLGQNVIRDQETHGSPSAQLVAEAGTPKVDRRSKVSRACDECRRKKARLPWYQSSCES